MYLSFFVKLNFNTSMKYECSKVISGHFIMSYYEMTYGEILDTKYLYQIIQNHNPYLCKNLHFYDLGSGYGNIVLQFRNHFKKTIGVELVKERHDIAEKKNNYLNVIFIHNNFFHIYLQNPCVVLVNNLCLGKGTNKRLGMKLLKELTNNDVLILTKKISTLEKYYIDQFLITCSWGESEIYVYKWK